MGVICVTFVTPSGGFVPHPASAGYSMPLRTRETARHPARSTRPWAGSERHDTRDYASLILQVLHCRVVERL